MKTSRVISGDSLDANEPSPDLSTSIAVSVPAVILEQRAGLSLKQLDQFDIGHFVEFSRDPKFLSLGEKTKL